MSVNPTYPVKFYPVSTHRIRTHPSERFHIVDHPENIEHSDNVRRLSDHESRPPLRFEKGSFLDFYV